MEPHEGKYDLLCSAATDPYTQCGFQKLICVSRLDDFLIHHLPNKYVGTNFGVDDSELRRQIDWLLKIGQNGHRSERLFQTESKRFAKDHYEPVNPNVVSLLPSAARSVLSIGCGWGATEGWLAERGLSVTAVPIDSVIPGGARAKGVEIIDGDFESARAKLAGRQFDCLLLLNVLHLVHDPVGVLSSFGSLLASGSVAIISAPNLRRLSVIAGRIRGDEGFKDLGNYEATGTHATSHAVVRRWCEAAGPEGPSYNLCYTEASGDGAPSHAGRFQFPVGFGLDRRGEKNLMAHERSFKNAVKWAYVTQGSEQGLNALLTFVFAAVLGPKDFGLVAMAMAYILFAKMLLEQGLVPALVQRKDLKQEHLDSVFYLNLALSLVLVALSIGFSKWWAELNHLPLLAPVISVLSIAIPLEGLTIVQRAVLQREMDFKSFSIRSVIAITVGGIVGLVMAFTHFGVWSLVGKQLTTDFVGLLALWKLGDWRPRFNFSTKAIKEITGFSAGAFAGNVGLFLNGQSDALLIGLFFGPVAVGLYRLASRLTNTVVTVATSSLQSASYPQFCRLQDKPAELRQSVLSCLRFAVTITIPALAGLAVVSKYVLAAVGPQWVASTNALRILCVVGMVLPIAYFGGPLLQAKGKPHFVAFIVWVQAAITAGSLVMAGRLLKHSSVGVQVTGIAVAQLIMAALILCRSLFGSLADSPVSGFARC